MVVHALDVTNNDVLAVGFPSSSQVDSIAPGFLNSHPLDPDSAASAQIDPHSPLGLLVCLRLVVFLVHDKPRTVSAQYDILLVGRREQGIALAFEFTPLGQDDNSWLEKQSLVAPEMDRSHHPRFSHIRHKDGLCTRVDRALEE